MGSPQYTKPSLSSLLDNPIESTRSGLLSTIRYHVYTLWLFTCDQVFDTVIPGTAFGILGAISGPVLDLPAQNTFKIIQRLPLVFTWLWVVILEFCVQNQRGSGSIEEDSINKPWRPIPAKRMSPAQAQRLLEGIHVLAATLSYRFNVLPIFGVYICLITSYNDYGGGNRSGVLRNLFCGAGFSCYFGGAMSIAVGPEISMGIPAWSWTLLITCGVLATTIQAQEFRDEVGDRARGRRTLVTEYSRNAMLWVLSAVVSFWTLYLPLVHFRGDWKVAAFPIIVGGSFMVTILQSMHTDSTTLDRRMYKAWCGWMFAFCPLPVLKGIMA
jgi:4-hydroxybenzoate polyprenyltransferase